MICIANYSVCAGGQCIGQCGSVKAGKEIADRHVAKHGGYAYVTESGKEISGKVLYDTRNK